MFMPFFSGHQKVGTKNDPKRPRKCLSIVLRHVSLPTSNTKKNFLYRRESAGRHRHANKEDQGAVKGVYLKRVFAQSRLFYRDLVA